VTPAASAFQGASFDGHGVYFAPAVTQNNGGPAVRFDVDAGVGFTQGSSWSSFSPMELATGTQNNAYLLAYLGSLFDGRFVYYVPNSPSGGNDNALLLRFDTTAPGGFPTKGSWTLYDLTTIDPNAFDFAGGVFDGRYIYLTPLGDLVVRFDARAPGPLPLDVGLPPAAQYGASFY
jgi:hypothetical protein